MTEIGKMVGVTNQLVSQINVGKVMYSDNSEYPLRKSPLNKSAKKQIENYCECCGAKISLGAKRCRGCSNKRPKSSSRNPGKSVLEELLKTQNFCSIAKMYNVSDTGVRKWCKSLGLPYNKVLLCEYRENYK